MSEEFSSKQIIRGTAITSLLTIVSRILGFFRDLIVAHVFGAGPLADAYFVAFRIPNLLRSFVAEGALSAAFVPIFSSEVKKGTDAAQTAFRTVSTFLIITTAVITVLGVIFANSLISFIAPGFEAPERELCVLMTRIMLPYIIFVSLIALFNGALTSLKSFGAAAAAQSVMNVVLIIGGLISALFEPRQGIIVLSVSVLLGGVIQVLAQLPSLGRVKLRFEFGFANSRHIISELLRLMAPALLGATIYQIIIFSATVLASLLQPGAVSWLFYADRVVQFPLGIFSLALGSVLLPALSENVAAQNTKSFGANLTNSLRFSSFALIPLSLFIIVSADMLVSILFERGAFSTTDAEMTASAVQALALGIWATTCHSLLVRSFMARRDNKTPTIIGALTLVVNLSVSLLCMGVIQDPHSSLVSSFLASIQNTLLSLSPFHASYGHIGLALASSIAPTFSFVVLLIILAIQKSPIGWRIFADGTVRALLAALAASVFTLSLPIGLAELPVLLGFALNALAFGGCYLLMQTLLRSREMKEIYQIATNRLSKNKNRAT